MQPLHDERLSEQVDEVTLLLQLWRREMLCDAHVTVVVEVELVDQPCVDRPFQE